MLQSMSLNSQNQYEIKIYGQPDDSWLGWFGEAKAFTETLPDDNYVTTLSDVLMDQAGLVGLIRRLHGHGIVLVSIRQVGPEPHLSKSKELAMISRIWHGWTTAGNADKYEALLREEIFVGIQNRNIRGFRGIQLLRRELGEEVEFVTIMTFDSLDAAREFAGQDYEAAVVPLKAREILERFDARSQHYEIIAERTGIN
jgi:heme-degrading monooxygenase HmoA